METTVVLLKPDCIEKNLVGEVIKRFEDLGLRIRGCKMFNASEALLKEHYSHLVDKPFFLEIIAFMQSSPIVALAIEGANSIASVRNHLGPTDSTMAPQGSIRGDYGTDKMRNIAHASDSSESAAAEIRRFFVNSELF
ncbi:MAG: Nucleoside diphosphate kinase [Verrucomicrobia subdivision 3 bacterium]|nr:Nucleoside diphosphate kinase [Limisphaerales bacterium]MCS1415860.1 Nucleoside diphosphate kinase [Limisphaerales bacterium]